LSFRDFLDLFGSSCFFCPGQSTQLTAQNKF
jgi:hypothetical protein